MVKKNNSPLNFKIPWVLNRGRLVAHVLWKCHHTRHVAGTPYKRGFSPDWSEPEPNTKTTKTHDAHSSLNFRSTTIFSIHVSFATFRIYDLIYYLLFSFFLNMSYILIQIY